MDPMTKWMAIVGLAVLHLSISRHMAMLAGRLGLSRLRWFALTLFLTAIPASIVLKRVRDRLIEEQAAEEAAEAPHPQPEDKPSALPLPLPLPKGFVRCPHCRRLIQPQEMDPATPSTCPRCGLRMEEETIA